MTGRQRSDDDRPLAVEPTQTAVFDGEAVVFDERTSTVHRLAAVAAAAWVCCDGDSTVADMTAELAEVFATDTASLRPHVDEALDALEDAGLLVGSEPQRHALMRTHSTTLPDGRTVIESPLDP